MIIFFLDGGGFVLGHLLFQILLRFRANLKAILNLCWSGGPGSENSVCGFFLLELVLEMMGISAPCTLWAIAEQYCFAAMGGLNIFYLVSEQLFTAYRFFFNF